MIKFCCKKKMLGLTPFRMEKSWDQDPDPHNKSSGSETLIMHRSLFNLHFRLELYNGTSSNCFF